MIEALGSYGAGDPGGVDPGFFCILFNDALQQGLV